MRPGNDVPLSAREDLLVARGVDEFGQTVSPVRPQTSVSRLVDARFRPRAITDIEVKIFPGVVKFGQEAGR
jgi:hypothetical protein